MLVFTSARDVLVGESELNPSEIKPTIIGTLLLAHYYWHSKCLKNAQRKSSIHSPGMIKLNLGLCLSLSLCHNSAFMGLTVDVLEQIQPFLHIVKCFPLLCVSLRVAWNASVLTSEIRIQCRGNSQLCTNSFKNHFWLFSHVRFYVQVILILDS